MGKPVLTKFLFTLTLLICWQSAIAKRPNEPEIGNYTKTTDVLPPSPNAAALGKYGGLAPNLSTGTINHTVPLHELVSSSLKLPISLNYNSNGLRVDEISSRVGTGWTLNAGGVVTRTVYGAVDEWAQRIAPPADLAASEADLLRFLQDVTISNNRGPYDAEPDVFSFNFNGHAGRFILDDAQMPILLEHSSLKIEKTMGVDANSRTIISGFTITTAEGVKYVFGGATATETTVTSQLGPVCGKNYDYPVTTAWYLKEILHPNNDFISFSYSPVNIRYYTGMSQIQYSDPQYQPIVDECVTCPPKGNAPPCFSQVEAKAVVLSEINSGNGTKVMFSYRDRLDTDDRLVSGITVIKPDGSAFKRFELNYTDTRATGFLNNYVPLDQRERVRYRHFLASVRECPGEGACTDVGKTHSFAYNGLNNLPPRLSFAQDHYGFFNGKPNTSLIPAPLNPVWKMALPNAAANREPNAAFSQKGLLSEITYPTGGRDSIIYEGNEAYTYVEQMPDETGIYIDTTGAGMKTSVTASRTFTVPFDQVVHYALQYDTLPDTGWQYDSHHHIAQFAIRDVTVSTTTAPFKTRLLTLENRLWQDTVKLKEGHTYQFSITPTGESVRASVLSSFMESESTYALMNKAMGGVRVAQVSTSDGSTGKTTLRKFHYSASGSTGQSSGVAGVEAKGQENGKAGIEAEYRDTHITQNTCTNSSNNTGGCMWRQCVYKTLSSNSVNNIYAFASSSVYYKTVVESLGEDFEGGGIEHRFEITPDELGEKLVGVVRISGAPHTSMSWKNGREYYKKVFRKEGEAIVPVQEVFTTYKDDERVSGEVKAYVVRQGFSPVDCHIMRSSDYDMVSYSHLIRWSYVESVRTLDYGTDGQGYTEETMLTQYGNVVHAQPTSLSTLTSGGEERVVQLFYPQDLVLSEQGAEAARQRLITDHVLAVPLEQRVSQGGKQTLRVRTDYKAFGNLVLPESQHVQSGNGPMEKRVEFSAYNAKGKLTEQAKTDDEKTSYLWGYGYAYPVAEIRNATYDEVKAALGGDAAVEALAGSATLSQSQLNLLNGLREQLPEAMVTIYTYDPLAGLTSSTDPNGRTTYYSYDTLGRLKTVKDHNDNVRKSYEYNYRK
ncbi:RHS repeat domain-containing protein [uncultured Pontibacter sp.]|uniref:RHS repeat domain-containing protein n=1 Tax=uncultured Pontibacter sp. TaxID=453356 RepID=UPI0026184938|nr:RHS repeat domain-containing protein [uncultured Pontibacter sp.]